MVLLHEQCDVCLTRQPMAHWCVHAVVLMAVAVLMMLLLLVVALLWIPWAPRPSCRHPWLAVPLACQG